MPELAEPTIAQAVANYLAGLPARRRRAAAWGLELLVHCLNGYASEALNPSEQQFFRRLFDAEDETHCEYCEIFGPDKIAPQLTQFFEWFLIRKVMAPAQELKRIATEVGAFMAWLGAQGLVGGTLPLKALGWLPSSRQWLESDEDGRTYGPVAIPATIGKKLAAGWTLSGALAPARRGATLLEVWNVYPSLASET